MLWWASLFFSNAVVCCCVWCCCSPASLPTAFFLFSMKPAASFLFFKGAPSGIAAATSFGAAKGPGLQYLGASSALHHTAGALGAAPYHATGTFTTAKAANAAMATAQV